MATTPTSESTYIVPDPATPKTIGVLNVIFGTLLGLCGICYGFESVSLMFMGPLMQGVGKQMQADLERQVQAQVEEAEDARLEAEDAKKEAANGADGDGQPANGQPANGAEQPDAGQPDAGQPDAGQPGAEAPAKDPAADAAAGDAAAGQPAQKPQVVMPMMPDMSEVFKMYDDPQIIGFGIVDAVTGLILNLLLLISGAGLLMLRPWARKLAVWTAWLKIGRLVVVYAFGIFVTIPVVANAMGSIAEKMMAQAPGGGPKPPAGTFPLVYSVMLTVMAVGMVLFGVIYPAISLRLLNKPASKAACRPAAPAENPVR